MALVDDHLQKIPGPQRSELQRIRTIVSHAYPDAEEVISYGMPGFKYKSKYLCGYDAFSDHLSFFPTSEPVEKLKDQLGAYRLSKGTIQFTVDNPLPEELILQLVAVRVAAIS